jgi:hypothetical protein
MNSKVITLIFSLLIITTLSTISNVLAAYPPPTGNWAVTISNYGNPSSPSELDYISIGSSGHLTGWFGCAGCSPIVGSYDSSSGKITFQYRSFATLIIFTGYFLGANGVDDVNNNPICNFSPGCYLLVGTYHSVIQTGLHHFNIGPTRSWEAYHL